eukprot:Gregarina_sp_Poly_1__9544@NODE_600_length_7248_cov_149_324885_g463_i0_p1_GENE_NODE_600_length_7248_cov_149_324885_g463_i0NODE_600_length_7248_cov_149_324885_g463_i0_p1_ORF_typecomplete_len515_score56_13Helicase_RecD/PF05127_14/0_00011Helicase_RecD/PF05127_14/2_8e03GNAT_acetyltr_2/PF13718_6/0_0057PanZ/PF12568_8/1_4e04PanZ/PF12568_8/0_14Acetyltransf_1/PF00583_25/0_28_NODE_600_length_7248_cov_149_324885_g463_i011812725
MNDELWAIGEWRKLEKNYRACIEEGFETLNRFIPPEITCEGLVNVDCDSKRARDVLLASFVCQAVLHGRRDVYVVAAHVTDVKTFFKILKACLEAHKYSQGPDFELFDLDSSTMEGEELVQSFIAGASPRTCVRLDFLEHQTLVHKQSVQFVFPWELRTLMSPDILVVLSISELMDRSHLVGQFLTVAAFVSDGARCIGEYRAARYEVELKHALGNMSNLRITSGLNTYTKISLRSQNIKKARSLYCYHKNTFPLNTVSVPLPANAQGFFTTIDKLFSSEASELRAQLLQLVNCDVSQVEADEEFRKRLEGFDMVYFCLLCALGPEQESGPAVLSLLVIGSNQDNASILHLITHPLVRSRGFGTEIMNRVLRFLMPTISNTIGKTDGVKNESLVEPLENIATELSVSKVTIGFPLKLDLVKFVSCFDFMPVGISSYPDVETGEYVMTFERSPSAQETSKQFLDWFIVMCLGTKFSKMPSRLVSSIINGRRLLMEAGKMQEDNVGIFLLSCTSLD